MRPRSRTIPRTRTRRPMRSCKPTGCATRCLVMENRTRAASLFRAWTKNRSGGTTRTATSIPIRIPTMSCWRPISDTRQRSTRETPRRWCRDGWATIGLRCGFRRSTSLRDKREATTCRTRWTGTRTEAWRSCRGICSRCEITSSSTVSGCSITWTSTHTWRPCGQSIKRLGSKT